MRGFRTPDISKQETRIAQTTFDANQAKGGGAMYMHNSIVTIDDSTLSNNSAEGAGALQADGTTLTFTNVTISGNRATTSPGGAISLFGGNGALTNCTFAENQCMGQSGKSFAAALFGGSALTINNTLFANQSSNDPNAPMTCQGSNSGSGDLQWPANHSRGGSPDPACVTNIGRSDPLLAALADKRRPHTHAPTRSGQPGDRLRHQLPGARPARACTGGGALYCGRCGITVTAGNQRSQRELVQDHGYSLTRRSESALRVVALNRKNWLFVGDVEAGDHYAILASLVATCEAHEIDPVAYLKDVLMRVDVHPASRIDDLLPHKWSPPFRVAVDE